MVQIPSWMNSTFKELSNEYSHAQIRVKMKKLWPQQVGEEKPVAIQKLGRDQEIVLQPENLVATRKLCRDQLAVSQPKTLQKPKKWPKSDILTYLQAHFTL